MNTEPSYKKFKYFAKKGTRIPVILDLTADCETPLTAYSKISKDSTAFLFESIVGGENINRYSFLGTSPKKIFKIHNKKTFIKSKSGKVQEIVTPKDPLGLIKKELSKYKTIKDERMPPFSGGAVGFVGHEFIHNIEPTIKKAEHDPINLPILYYLITDSVLIFDHVKQVLKICVYAEIQSSPKAAYERATQEIKRIYDLLQEEGNTRMKVLPKVQEIKIPRGNLTKKEFIKSVNKIKDYIKKGDVIQTVLSQRFTKKFTSPPINLYRALRTVNPSPYMFLLQDKDFSVVGASPEVHVRLTKKQIEIRPIAGTRRRGRNNKEDISLEKELLADKKECAEHLMLIDLARNDIGRVSKYDSVNVSDYMTIERYSHVMHIVSQVNGELDSQYSAYDLMKSTFPAGTLSGAPKIRALQIISELERTTRGIYGGALGYFGFNGNHDSCIGIRTALIKDKKIHIQSGAGIVADSKPKDEYMETINKANAMFKAATIAEKIN